jgi:hypothetical protein
VPVLDDVQIHLQEAGYRSVDSIYEKDRVSLTSFWECKGKRMYLNTSRTLAVSEEDLEGIIKPSGVNCRCLRICRCGASTSPMGNQIIVRRNPSLETKGNQEMTL